MCMVRKVSLNDYNYKQIIVGENATKYRDREDQHKYRNIQVGDQEASHQVALSHCGNNQAVTIDL